MIHCLFERALSLSSFDHKFELLKPDSYEKKVVKKLASDESRVRSEPSEKYYSIDLLGKTNPVPT